jgi:hypothetical protein
MKELTMPEKVYNTEFDINIRPYLLVEECYDIATHVVFECETPMEKQVARDCNMLKWCTDIENLESYMYSDLYNSGLIGCVKNEVVNFDNIVDFEKQLTSVETRFGALIDSATTLLTDVDKKLPEKFDINKIIKSLEGAVKKLNLAELKLEKVFSNDNDKK